MNARLLTGKEIDRAAWLALLSHSPQAALYHHPDYLDVVAPGWQAIEVLQDCKLIAIMPILPKEKGGYAYSLQPSFTQFWGVVMANEGSSGNYKTYSHRRKVVKAVVDALPPAIRWFKHGFAPEFDYPHPFHWTGHTLTTRYTYRLPLAEGLEAVVKSYGSDTRYDMRKAANHGISVRPGTDATALLRLVQANAAAGKALLTAAEEETLGRIVGFLLAGKMGYLLESVMEDGIVVGAVLCGSGWGKTMLLMTAQDPATANTGAMTLLVGEAIARAVADGSATFDFEGSMIEGIEGFFRGFGGRPVPYLMIEKNALPLPIRWIRKLR